MRLSSSFVWVFSRHLATSFGNGSKRSPRAGKGKLYAKDIAYAEADEISEALARDVSQADRMMDLLSKEVDPDTESELKWLEIFLVQIAGSMRYEPAIPLIIKKFLIGGELLNEGCDKALTKIGTDSVVQAVREIFPHAPSYFRLYASGIFGNIHSDLAISSGLDLLSTELDLELKAWLAAFLLDQFSTEAIDAARSVLVKDHSRSVDLKSQLVVACKLMDYDVPELERWKRDLAAPRRPYSRRGLPNPAFDDFEMDFDKDLDDEREGAPISTSVKTGRNDPCPCGSGKKFKKCCLNKSRETW